ncbi:urease accessory protein UreD [Polaromonas naphthalenivorans]|uniref:Urease accessory protein UreD n=1 Tax=Polaromonas naphthalenivorans (strain CJ2) TaxID=365044 RepID=URED_POLNA|nr:urease accessory protein UreD [Polaromonas naphthalenivorans]A1VKZ3.1 RecName: Full=Urease accessory protein UreD [Polaromonas naphthalenivorans CJ2]ABM36321.1 Urease accessory protein UreD [Polaromonas naphthalenivorans CJ2]
MTWNATLALDYTRQAEKTVAHFRHSGPLRILQSLYPEGDGICHNVIVHPPGGLVGGDTLDLAFTAGAGAHGLVTTPGATRFYRSTGEPALQRTRLSLEAGARMEWLPLEAICYSGCLAENRLTMELASGAELIGWDVTAFGLPAASLPFAHGHFCQHIEMPGVWLERARIAAGDTLLMDSPLGLAGQRCMASIFFVAGSKLERNRRQQALDVAREVIEAHALRATAGATSPDGQVVVVRVLAPLVEPAMTLLRQVWQAWRSHFWQQPAALPRIWSM